MNFKMFTNAACDCNEPGSIGRTCGDDGQCRCKKEFTGLKCNECAPGYFGSNEDCQRKIEYFIS